MNNKTNQVEEMMNDIGPERQMEHNGQKISCIFYDKATLAKVLVARGWEKVSKNSVTLSREDYESIRNSELNLDWEVDKKVKEELDRVEKEASKEKAERLLNEVYWLISRRDTLNALARIQEIATREGVEIKE